MEEVLEVVKQSYESQRCDWLRTTTGGIVNEGKAGIVQLDEQSVFVKYNNTPFVSMHGFVYFLKIDWTSYGHWKVM